MKPGIKTTVCVMAALLASCTAQPPVTDGSVEPPPEQREQAFDTGGASPVQANGETVELPEIYEIRGDAANSLADFKPSKPETLYPFTVMEGGRELYGFCDARGRVAVRPAYDSVERVIFTGPSRAWLYWVHGGDGYFLTEASGKIIYGPYANARLNDSYTDGGADYITMGYLVGGRPEIYGVFAVDGFGDIEGRERYTNVSRFSEGLAAVKPEGSSAYRYIGTDGEIALFGPYEYAGAFSGGMAVVCYEGLWGVVGRNGDWVIPPAYDAAQNFGGGVFPACLNGMWGLVDRDGSAVFPFDYTSIIKEDSGVYLLTRDGLSPGAPEVSFWYDAQSGRVVEGEGGISYIGGGIWTRVREDSVELMLERDGATEVIYGANSVKWVSGDLLEVESNSGSNLYKVSSGFLTNFENMTLRGGVQERSMLVVSENGKSGLLGIDGGVLLPCEYDSVSPIGGGLCYVRGGGVYGVIDTSNGEWILRK